MDAFDRPVLADLAPVAERLLERHLATAKEWLPYKLIPWGRASDFGSDYKWSPDEYHLEDAVRSALYINLLTEDNLPYYTHLILSRFGEDSVWGQWSRQWTAEESRHADVIRDLMIVTRAIDLTELERAKMEQVRKGQVPQPQSAMDAWAYTTLQELATRVAHLATGQRLPEHTAKHVMTTVAGDEGRHYAFFGGVSAAALEAYPSDMMLAIERQVIGFQMPGTGIPGFARHAFRVAMSGIYGTQAYCERVLEPVVLEHWKVDQLTGLSAAAERAQQAVMDHIKEVRIQATKEASKRQRRAEQQLAEQSA